MSSEPVDAADALPDPFERGPLGIFTGFMHQGPPLDPNPLDMSSVWATEAGPPGEAVAVIVIPAGRMLDDTTDTIRSALPEDVPAELRDAVAEWAVRALVRVARASRFTPAT